MSCAECRNIGDYSTIQYEPPDDDIGGTFSIYGGDSYYSVPGVEYCPFCGAKLVPPKTIRKTPDSGLGECQLSDPLETWEAISGLMRLWTTDLCGRK